MSPRWVEVVNWSGFMEIVEFSFSRQIRVAQDLFLSHDKIINRVGFSFMMYQFQSLIYKAEAFSPDRCSYLYSFIFFFVYSETQVAPRPKTEELQKTKGSKRDRWQYQSS